MAWLLAIALATTACGTGPAPEPARYNVVLVLSDALRASNLPLYGYPRETAPRLGELAAESVVFDHHQACFPATPYSVSQMQSGRLMPPLLMDFSYAEAPVKAVTDDLLILPRAFREAGYRTGIVTSHPWFNRLARLLDHFDVRTLEPPRKGEAYAPFERLLPDVDEFLDAAPEPFFLYVHSMDTHDPFLFRPGFDEYRDADDWPEVYNAYDSGILYTDHWFGRLVDGLRARGLLDRTVVVFTSDHGEELGEMGPEYWNRHHGYTVRRVQLHVPLVVRMPNGEGAGRRVSVPTSHLDLAPTLLSLAGAGVSLDRYRVDGRDLSDLALGRSSAADPDPTLYAYSGRYWGLYRGDLELHYDAWQDRVELARTETARFNYPMSVEVEGARGEARLSRDLKAVRARRLRERHDLPANDAMPGTVVIGVPTTVVASDGPPPTYDVDPDDGRWGQNLTLRLEAGPEERPSAVTLATPWVPGRYRILVRLARNAPETGGARPRNRFRLRYPGTGEEALDLDGAAAGGGLLDTGVHDLGDTFEVEVSEPEGGVAIAGFVLRRVGAGAEETGDAEVPPDLEERLRALGYVQ